MLVALHILCRMVSAGPLLLLLAFLLGTFASEDLRNSVFLFPKESSTARVVINANLNKPLLQLSVCLRSYSELTRLYALFTLAVPLADNIFHIFMSPTQWRVWVNKELYEVASDPKTLKWTHSCLTWNSTSGVIQMWENGKVYPRRAGKKGATIVPEAFVVLGQNQDSYGDTFYAPQSFVGEMSDVHMWDYVLNPEQIKKNMNGSHLGNVVNWNALNYEIKGEVLVEPKLQVYGSDCSLCNP